MAVIYKVKSIDTIYNSMKQYMIGKASQITNFNIGSRIRTILEAIAIVNHRTQYDFNVAIKKSIPLAVYNGFEFERNPGLNASGELQFYRVSPAESDYVIPIGTKISLDGVNYETLEETTIFTGDTSSLSVTAKCSTAGVIGNIGIDEIDTLAGKGQFISQPLGVESAKNPVVFSGGQDEESDEDRLKRFREYINSLARATVLGIETGVKTIPSVLGVTVVENNPVPGTNTIYVDDGSGVISPTLKADVEKIVNGDRSDRFNYQGYRAAGTKIVVLSPTPIDIAITIELKILSSSLADDGVLVTLSTAAIQKYINTLPLGHDVLTSEITRVVKNVSQDIYDVILTVPSGNVIISPTQKASFDTNNYYISSTRITYP